MGRRLYLLVETRSYQYNNADPTATEDPSPYLKIGITAESFRRNPTLRSGGNSWADQCTREELFSRTSLAYGRPFPSPDRNHHLMEL
jgi:hypothetical protein